MRIKHILQRSLFNNIENWYLQLRMCFLSNRPIEGERRVLPPLDYELVFEDTFDSDELSDRWRVSQPWGEFHSNSLKQYWPTDNSCVYPTPEGLVLDLRNIPKTYRKSELPPWQQKPELPDEFTINWAAGLVLLKQPYRFGWFEVTIQLPTNRSQWTAFWLSGSATWPPEIDVFESYTHGDPDRIRVEPNIHWGRVEDRTKKDYGAPRIRVKDPHRRWVQYAVHWTPEFIKFYYDGALVQVCRNKEMLSDNRVEQTVILNNGVNPVKGVTSDPSPMLVKYFRIYQEKPTASPA